MIIGIIGVGQIVGTLALKLAKAGHQWVVANSSSAENIAKEMLATPRSGGSTSASRAW